MATLILSIVWCGKFGGGVQCTAWQLRASSLCLHASAKSREYARRERSRSQPNGRACYGGGANATIAGDLSSCICRDEQAWKQAQTYGSI
eukprot:1140227-Pelagomonas_calceolata.AAC.5